MLEYFLITIIFIAIALFALSIRLLVKKGGNFPDTHISHNKDMKQRGINCYKTQEKIERIKVAVNGPAGNQIDDAGEFGCFCSQKDKSGCAL